MMLRSGLIIAVICLSACAGPGTTHMDEAGIYHFPSQPFQVAAPVDCLPKMSVHQEPTSVRFTTGRNNWQAGGDYRMQIHNYSPGSSVDKQDFLRMARNAYINTMESVGNTVLLAEDIEVNGRTAFQGLASDNGKAVVMGTTILFPRHLVITQFLYPFKPGVSDMDDVPMECYQRFIESIEYLDE